MVVFLVLPAPPTSAEVLIILLPTLSFPIKLLTMLDFLFDIIVDILFVGLGTIDNIGGDSRPDFSLSLILTLVIDFFLKLFFFLTLLSFISGAFTEELLLLSDNALILTSSVLTPTSGDGFDLDDGTINPDLRGGVFDGVDMGDSVAVDGDIFEFTFLVLYGVTLLVLSLKFSLLALGNKVETTEVDESFVLLSTSFMSLVAVIAVLEVEDPCSLIGSTEEIEGFDFFDTIPFSHSKSGNVIFA